MLSHLRYLKYVLIHKWFVFLECCKLGIPIRGLLHDLSKFSPAEWNGYRKRFFVPSSSSGAEFDAAWLRHQHRNPHHWQFWLLCEDDGGALEAAARAVLLDAAQDQIECQRAGDYQWIHRARLKELEAAVSRPCKVLEMPLAYRKEMLADWRAMSRVKGGTVREFYENARDRGSICLAQETQHWIEERL
jgi:hypothetical protein